MRAGSQPPGRALGYVDDELLPGLYAGAELLLMPSLYEGFGLPCLEAMACGTPVVAANRGALPEIYSDAALMVDPEDADALADAAVSVASDGARRVEMMAAGLARAAELTWDRAARETDALIDSLLGERPRPPDKRRGVVETP
jgi:glycosyltransferase involved in cell wall biosynthesis